MYQGFFALVLPGSAPGLGPVVRRRAAPAAPAVAAPASAARPGPGPTASATSASSAAAATAAVTVPAPAPARSGRHLDADTVLETRSKMMIEQIHIGYNTYIFWGVNLKTKTHTCTYPAESSAVQTPDRVFGVPVVLKFDKGEAGRVPGDPHVPQRTIFGAGVLQVVLARVVAEVTDVHL